MVGGANAQDLQGWKRPWGLCGVGLRLKEQKGPRRDPHPWSQRAGDLTWEPSRLPGLEWAEQTPSSPLFSYSSGLGSGGPLPPASPDLPGLRGAALVWSPLLLPPRSLYVLPVHSGVPPVSLEVRVPHQWPAGALVVGRH